MRQGLREHPKSRLILQLLYPYLSAIDLCSLVQALCLHKHLKGKCIGYVNNEVEEAWKDLFSKDYALFYKHILEGPESPYWPVRIQADHGNSLSVGSNSSRRKRLRRLPKRFDDFHTNLQGNLCRKTCHYVKARSELSFYEIYKLTVSGELLYWVQIRNPFSIPEYILSAYDGLVQRAHPQTKILGRKHLPQFVCKFVLSNLSARTTYTQLRFPPKNQCKGGNPFLVEFNDRPQSTPWCKFEPLNLHGMSPGQYVEVQWKLKHSHVFGWWLTKIIRIEGANVTFLNEQFDTSNPWRTVTVNWENTNNHGYRLDPVAGFIGGIVTLNSATEWHHFFPKTLIP